LTIHELHTDEKNNTGRIKQDEDLEVGRWNRSKVAMEESWRWWGRKFQCEKRE